jgi:uncharacterized membrane protein YczE
MAAYNCLIARANLGISTISSLPYVITRASGLSLGKTQLIINVLFVLIQLVWLGKGFSKLQYLQFVSSIIFSFFIETIMPFTFMFDYTRVSLGARIVEVGVAIIICAVGLVFLNMIRLTMLPADGLVKTISIKINKPFGKVRVFFECTMVILTCLVSIILMGRIEGIFIGTVAAALLTGNLVRLFSKIMNPLSFLFT